MNIIINNNDFKIWYSTNLISVTKKEEYPGTVTNVSQYNLSYGFQKTNSKSSYNHAFTKQRLKRVKWDGDYVCEDSRANTPHFMTTLTSWYEPKSTTSSGELSH